MIRPFAAETERLILRRWTGPDVEDLARLNADAETMRFFPRVYQPDETKAAVKRWEAHFDQYGFGIVAIIERKSGRFAGMCGLIHTKQGHPFPTPRIEFAWRMEKSFRGLRFAGEAAIGAANAGLPLTETPELIAYTAAMNDPSRRVMEKLGLAHDPEQDFDHAELTPDSHLRRHVVHAIPRADWNKRHGAGR